MFDYVRFTRTMPDGFTTGDTWAADRLYQTKCLGYAPHFVHNFGPDLNLYEVGDDDRLVLVVGKWEDPTPENGSLRILVDYTGTMDLLGSRQNSKVKLGSSRPPDYDFHEYRMHFVNGVLTKLTVIPEPLTPEQQAEEDRATAERKAEWDAKSPEDKARLEAAADKAMGEEVAKLVVATTNRPGFARKFLAQANNGK
jgi:hypothetical protein